MADPIYSRLKEMIERTGDASEKTRKLSLDATSPYMSLKEAIAHIGGASERAKKHFSADEIRVGDEFRIEAPGEPLHGTRHVCIGVKEGAIHPETGDKIPYLIEFLLQRADYPKLVKLPQPCPKDLDKNIYAEVWAEDERKCKREGPRNLGNEAIIAMAFAIREITSTAERGDIVVEGCRKGYTTPEDIPRKHWKHGRLDVINGRLFPKNPFAPDAVIWEALDFPQGEVKELWPLPATPRSQQKGGTNAKHDEWVKFAGEIAGKPGCPKYRGFPNQSEIARRVRKRGEYTEDQATIRRVLTERRADWAPGA